MTRTNWTFAAFLVLVLAGACVAPFLVKPYTLEILIIFLINLILVCSYRIPAMTGDWSLSHVVMMGVGAYTTALLSTHLDLSILLTVPLSAIVAGILGYIIVLPMIRTRGFGFFIASFAIGEFVRLTWVKFRDVFGGPRGMIGIPNGEIGSIDLFFATPSYFFMLVIAFICLTIMYRIDKSRIGSTFVAIYKDEELAEAVGINVPHYRALAFATGTFFAGIAGALLAHRLGAVDPKGFDINTMVYLIIWIVVGGSATFWGPIVGLIVVTFAFEWTRPLLEWRPLLFGGLLIFFLVFLPGGLESLLAKIRQRLVPGQNDDAAASPGTAGE
ncbi:branched-chain amino acid ABC transporter permease [Maritimibacter sp. 55A14]|uniref:branched-chain amino acid ABC transporter permease n=1 Tax=Maritimibacter sp. 55A14 TaxID=2174844 RepID=UPI001304C841|nr:branched-chain amino acid ABC transporter permease [Maritimibacter sp. 55A14]